MLSRITLVFVTVFWLCMTFLLWRSEFGGRNHAGTTVPIEVVWQKILTAPDTSRLQITHHGKESGFCQWSANNVGPGPSAAKILTDGAPPEAPAQKLMGYRIDFEGNFSVVNSPNRLGFTVGVIFATNLVWQEFNAMLKLRPDNWNIHARASEQSVHLRMDNEDDKTEHVYKFSDLQNPQFLAQEFQLPVSLQLLNAIGFPTAGQSAATLSPGLVWEARNDWVTLGHTSVRAYRIQARLFDRYGIIVMISQVGEILRVELPDEWVLVNDQFSNL